MGKRGGPQAKKSFNSLLGHFRREQLVPVSEHPASRYNEDNEQKFRDQLQGLRDYLILNRKQRSLFYSLTENKEYSPTFIIEKKHRIEALNAMNFVWNPVQDQPWAYKNNGITKIADVVSEF
jgi:hypothetical protein